MYVSALFLRYRQNEKSGLPTPEKTLLGFLLLCYFVTYVYLTLSYRSPMEEAQSQLQLFWSYRDAFDLENGFKIKRLGLARQILLNILVYVPVGLLMPITYYRLREGVRDLS